MIQRSTWYVLGIFAVVILGAVLFQRWQGSQEPEPVPTPSTGELWSLSSDAIATIRLEDRSGRVFLLGRDEQGLWKVIEPSGGETDLARAESAVSQLGALRYTAQLDSRSDLSVYGLQSPAYVFTINLNGGSRYILRVGDITPLQNGYYVQLNENAPQVVNKFSLDTLLPLIDEPPFAPTPAPTEEGEELPDS